MFDIKRDMERNWNVIKFTCGLMADSSELIETVCKVFAEQKMSTDEENKYSFGYLYDHHYLKDLSLERSPQSVDPFNNSEICCMNDSKSELRENCSLYYFYGTYEYMKYTDVAINLPSRKSSTKPCGIIIKAANSPSCMSTALNACALIAQPIKLLEVEEPHYYDTDREFCFVNVCAVEEEPYLRVPKWRKQGQKVIDSLDCWENKTFCPTAVASFKKCNFKRTRDNLEVITNSLKRFRNLSKLFLYKCKNIPETVFSILETNRGLTHLEIKSNDRSQESFPKLVAELKHLKCLEVLILHGVVLTDKVMAAAFIVGMAKLRFLYFVSLHKCYMQPQTVAALMKIITKCPLSKLNLSDNNLSGVFHELSRLPTVRYQHLWRIDLVKCDLQKFDIIGLARIIKDGRLPDLEQINLHKNYGAFDKEDALEILAQTCESIFKLQPIWVQAPVGEKLRKKRYSCLEARYNRASGIWV